MKFSITTTVLCTLFGVIILQPLSAQPTTLDPGFADGGALIAPNTNLLNFQNTYGIVEMSDGHYLGLGNKGVNLGFLQIRMTLMKYDICGVPDSTFGAGGLSSLFYQDGIFLEIFDAQELPDGKILCVGKYSNTGAVSSMRPALVRLMPDGSFDTTYGTDGVLLIQPGAGSSGNFSSLIKIPGGKLIASVGRYPHIGGGNVGTGLVRTLPDGTPDPSFGNGGVSVHLYPGMGYAQAFWERVHLVNDSTYWLTRAESMDGGATYRPIIYAFDTSGTVLSAFGSNGRLQDPTLVNGGIGRSIESTLDAEGRMVFGFSQAQVVDGAWVYRMVFMRYLPDGTLDTSFGDNGYTTSVINIPGTGNNWPGTLGVNSDGTIRATFVHALGTGDFTTVMIQLDTDGNVVNGYPFQLPLQNTGITALKQIDEDRWLAQGFGGGTLRHQSQLRFNDTPVVLPNIELTGSVLTTSGSGPDYQWFLDGEVIADATGAVHTPTANGSYTVEMTDVLGCPQESEAFDFTTLNASAAEKNDWRIINNPAQDVLRVHNDRENLRYEIININGQRMAAGQMVHGVNAVQVGDLARGMYLLRVLDDQNAKVGRFVKD